MGAVRAEPCACFYLISSQSPAPAVDCFIVRSNCCSCYRVVQMCFGSTVRPVDQLCLPLPPPPIRGGLVGARTNVRAEPLQSPAPAASDVQSPAPALHAQSRMASSSAGPSRDPEWLLQTRTRQMQQRRTAGAPGAERWQTVETDAMEAAEEWAEESGPAAARASHEGLRSAWHGRLAHRILKGARFSGFQEGL